MKFFLITISTIVLALSTVYARPSFIKTFEEFKRTFNKSYASAEEENFRLQNFLESLKYVEENQHLGVEINHFSDLSLDEFKSKYLTDENTFDNVMAEFDANSQIQICQFYSRNILPHLDLRSINTTPIRMQEQCGSCWAFSAVASVESAYLAKNNITLDLSEQELVDCSSKHGCRGSRTVLAFNYIKNRGITTEKVYPYNARENRCLFHAYPRFFISNFCKIYPPSEKSIQSILSMTNTAISVSLRIKNINAFRHYNGKTIIRDDVGNHMLGHAMNIVGYGNKEGVDYWIVRNSWDTMWGDNGYVYIEMHKNLMNINDYAYVVIE